MGWRLARKGWQKGWLGGGGDEIVCSGIGRCHRPFKKKIFLKVYSYMVGTFKATARFQILDVFQKARKMFLRCVLSVISHHVVT